jgi:insertion element IS1 protein InsB
VTKVDRATRCFIGCSVVWERTSLALQRVVDQGPPARQYFSDAFNAYATLGYAFGTYTVSDGKRDTYSVEGDNAELRHYLARLARRSRCFTRCPIALCHALRLFFYAYNARQLYKANAPQYPAHVFEFVAPLN